MRIKMKSWYNKLVNKAESNARQHTIIPSLIALYLFLYVYNWNKGKRVLTGTLPLNGWLPEQY